MSRFAVLLVAVFAFAGCGGDDTTTSSSKAPPTVSTLPAAAGNDLTIHMSEFAFDPKDAVARAGKVTITAANDGKAEHELVLLKTDADPAKLPKDGGEVDESSSVGEIADVPAGASKSHTFMLAPGKYAMVCALPGHYEGGMYGSLTVQ